jgi:hypothetical protein
VTMKCRTTKHVDGRGPWPVWRTAIIAAAVAFTLSLASGCETPSAHTTSRNFSLRGDLPIDPPGPMPTGEDECAEGGRLWKQYCGSCHNARPLGERPFSNYHVAVAHMRDQAYLTGKEYRQIIAFLRRWQDVGPATPPVNSSPKRFEFSQPVSELRGETPPAEPAPPAASNGPFALPEGERAPAPQPVEGAPGGLPPALEPAPAAPAGE